jgi:hypothetical protein
LNYIPFEDSKARWKASRKDAFEKESKRDASNLISPSFFATSREK